MTAERIAQNPHCRAAACDTPAKRRHAWPRFAAAALALLAPVASAQIAPGADLDVPFVTTPDKVVDAMLSMAGVGSRDFLLDLGSGDGRIVITAALKHGARGLGVEIDPELVRQSNDNARKAGVAERARFAVQDLFATDLTQASVITMYLLPDVNLKLRPALLKLKPGTRIVSHDWDLGDWEPDRRIVLDVPDKKFGLKKESVLMLWKVPTEIHGIWSVPKRLHLDLEQSYQKLKGKTLYRGETYSDTVGKVDGTKVQICFTHHTNGSCKLGASGALQNGQLRLLIDGAGRQQATVLARRAPAPPPPAQPKERRR